MVSSNESELNTISSATLIHAALILFLPFLLIISCWNAPFLPYDDADHIWQNACVVGNPSLVDFFSRPRERYTWQPLTTLSYRLDYLMFKSGRLPVAPASDLSENWAGGVRTMTCVYHGLAALALWRVLVLLGLTPLQALFCALAFGVHPIQCETLCWCAERKTALMGLFSFAALWAWLAGRGRIWRVPLTTLLYALALLSKASALGIMPVIALVEMFETVRLRRSSDATASEEHPLLISAVELAPLIALSLFMTLLNISLYSYSILPPPGGSKFTALLTDVPILVRYLVTALAPVRLSFNYYCEPVSSLADARLWTCGALVAAAVAITLYFSANRWRAGLGWLWFVTALAPSANLVATHTLMHDRFLYLSLPGIFLVVVEVIAGLGRRWAQRLAAQPRLLSGLAALGVAILLSLGIARSSVFGDGVTLFGDSIAKEPLCAHTRYGMWISINDAMHRIMATGERSAAIDTELATLRALGKASAIAFVDRCADTRRQLNYCEMAIVAADYSQQDGELDAAERYFKLAAWPPEAYMHTSPQIEAEAMRNLATFRFRAGKIEDAFDLADNAVRVCPSFDLARFARAEISLALHDKLATVNPVRAKAFLEQAGRDFESIPTSSKLYSQAQSILHSPLFAY